MKYITVSIPSIAEMNDMKLRILCLEQRVKELEMREAMAKDATKREFKCGFIPLGNGI